MQRNLSVYLDLLRVLAALAVVLGHLHSFVNPHFPETISTHHQEAVAIFFVMSGFFMRFVTKGKETRWQLYAAARLTRLSSVVPLAIIITVAADALTSFIDPVALARAPYAAPTVASILSYVTFTNELWFTHSVVGSNTPYWSLGFEVWYYIFFAALTFVPGRMKWLAMIAVAAVAGPKIMAFLPLWWLGVWTFDICARIRTSQLLPGAVLFGAIFPAYGWMHWKADIYFRGIHRFPDGAQALGQWSYYTGLGLLMALNMIGFHLLTVGRKGWPEKSAAAIRWAAGGSFTLYLVHQPLLLLASAILPSARYSLVGSMFALAMVLVAVYLAAEFGERRKAFFAKLFRPLSQAGSTPIPSASSLSPRLP